MMHEETNGEQKMKCKIKCGNFPCSFYARFFEDYEALIEFKIFLNSLKGFEDKSN